ncbi:hypothetical protein IT575_03560 [bacterium]|nr:hypothetical protein [bacterium]
MRIRALPLFMLVLPSCLVLLGAGARQPPSKLKATVPDSYERLAPKGLIRGKSLGWHTVYREPDSRGVLANQVSCFSADFGPGDELQLLLCYDAAAQSAVLISGDGSTQSLGLPLQAVCGPAWDFDADGVCEVGVMGAGAEGRPELQFLSLQGQKVGALSAQSSLPERSLCLDYDGDGRQEVLLQNGVERESILSCYASSGRLLSSFKGGISPLANPVGDLDGDGRQERVLEDFGTDPAFLVGVALDDSRQRYKGWPQRCMASLCADINRDGRCEVFGGRGYFNPALGTFNKFEQFELEWDRLQRTRATPVRETAESERLYLEGRVLVGDFTHDGIPEALVYAGTPDCGGILVFSLDGRSISYEEFGEPYYGGYKLVQGGKDYAALIMQDRVLIAP